MGECKNCYSDGIECKICNYCFTCHNNEDVNESCASYLITEKRDIFVNKRDNLQKIYRCLSCGSDTFIVGHTDTCETSIKCPNCGFEKLVHEG